MLHSILRRRLLHAVLGQPLEVLFDRLAEVGGKLAADLLEDFLPLLGRQVAPAVLLAEALGIDLAGAAHLGGLAVLHGLIRALAAGLAALLLLLLLLFFQLLDHFFELGDDRVFLIADGLAGAGLPHLPAVLSASKSYSERLFTYHRIDRLDRSAVDLALIAPAAREDVEFTQDALDALYEAADGYPYFVQAYGKATWDVAAASPITVDDVRVAAPAAEEELAVGFFGSRYERATPAEREYMRAMADLSGDDGPVATSKIAAELGRKPASLSPARDGLIKKGLIYSAERGFIGFTVPHFGRYLRAQSD